MKESGNGKKAGRLEAFVADLGLESEGWPVWYAGYFTCFNAEQYYEAHDVLEQLWLRERGPDRDFYKALIQFAGAHVHLQKQAARPDHPTDGRRLGPAARLFQLAANGLERYPDSHLGLCVTELITHCEEQVAQLTADGYTRNPWQPGKGLQLKLTPWGSGNKY